MRVQQRFEPAIVRWAVVAFVVVLLLLIASVAAACPNCKEGLAQNDPQGTSIAAGYYYSILFMMSMPFLILGGVSAYFYYEICRARQAAALPSSAGRPASVPSAPSYVEAQ